MKIRGRGCSIVERVGPLFKHVALALRSFSRPKNSWILYTLYTLRLDATPMPLELASEQWNRGTIVYLWTTAASRPFQTWLYLAIPKSERAIYRTISITRSNNADRLFSLSPRRREQIPRTVQNLRQTIINRRRRRVRYVCARTIRRIRNIA